MRHSEVEFKYNADDISLARFQEFCDARTPPKKIDASGYDHFYRNAKEPDAFCRMRIGHDMIQLTFKRKPPGADSVVRTEHNINLTKDVSKEAVQAFLKEFGYVYDTSIFKNCFVYTWPDHTLVYYICYNKDLTELGRFVEIEANEDYNWASDQDAKDAIVALERICKPLGVSPQCRMKKSLFELFKTKE